MQNTIFVGNRGSMISVEIALGAIFQELINFIFLSRCMLALFIKVHTTVYFLIKKINNRPPMR